MSSPARVGSSILSYLEDRPAAGRHIHRLYASQWRRRLSWKTRPKIPRVGLRGVGHVRPETHLERVLTEHWTSIEHSTQYFEYAIDAERRWKVADEDLFFFLSRPLADTAAWTKARLSTRSRSADMFLNDLDNTGTVAVGKRADVVLLNGNPLRDLRQIVGPVSVMIAGCWISRRDIEARFDAFPTGEGDSAKPPAAAFYAAVRRARRRMWGP